MKKKNPTTESDSEPTPKQLPTMDEVEEAMKGVDLWEVGKTHKLIALGRKDRRPWLKPPDPSQDPPWENPKKRMFWFVIKFWDEFRWGNN